MSLFSTFADDIHETIVNFADSGRPFAVAVVLRDAGSTPRKAATKAVIDADGKIHGTIGGGAVEARARELAIEAIGRGRSVVFDFALEGSHAEGDSPICGGVMRILIDPAASVHRDVYARAVDARRSRTKGLLITTVHDGDVPKIAVEWLEGKAAPQGVSAADLAAIDSAIQRQTPLTIARDLPYEGDTIEALIEPIIPRPVLLIAGGGHVGQALAVQAGLVGFAVTVIDDRSEFTETSLYPPGVATRCCDMAEELRRYPLAGDTYIVIVTRGHQHDQAALAACVGRNCAYIGMIGSKRKVAMIGKALRDCGAADEQQLARVYAPIGLDIGAQTVPEIAASIVAQLVSVRRTGQSLRMPTSGGAR